MKGFVLGVVVTLALLAATVSFAKVNERSLLQALLPQMVVQIEQDVPVTAYLQLPNTAGDAMIVTLPLTLAVDLRIGLSSPLSVTLDVGEGSDIVVVANLPTEPTQSPADGLDRTNAAQVAAASLTLFRERDLAGLSEISTAANRRILAELAEQGPSNSRYQSVFQGWRWDAVQAWDGTIEEVRYRHFVGSADEGYEAQAKFGELDYPEIATLVLKWEDGQWAFEDISSPNLSTFEKGREEFSLDSAPY